MHIYTFNFNSYGGLIQPIPTFPLEYILIRSTPFTPILISESPVVRGIVNFLGVGDRHLENLMINNEGKMFHIDFGFILGKDPKPWPPPFKLCKEMVEGMGGEKTEFYTNFK